MLFKIEKCSDYAYKDVKELNTLEEFIEFVNENEQIVIRKTWDEVPDNSDMTIEIYDIWRE